ncbi:uncharacterized protein [Parasteatoda tepidariorum]|uniref:uncharacterized protein n=1 Tax=Parasteatoda tepidariorum TaxID=114398 RepID=UPI00077FD780|nr:uncharacterized protein LOC107447375 [Parasteatoda tepidariorum]
MTQNFATTHEIDYGWQSLLSEAKKQGIQPDYRFLGYLSEPKKHSAFEETTYDDHFGPKANFPSETQELYEGPISTALVTDRAKHMVTTTQRDYDGRKAGSNTRLKFLDNDFDYKCSIKGCSNKSAKCYDDPLDILNTIGPVPLVKTCRAIQKWETTYKRDYV